MSKHFGILMAAVALIAVLLIQFKIVAGLREDVAFLKEQLGGVEQSPTATPQTDRPPVATRVTEPRGSGVAQLNQRMALLEDNMAEMARLSKLLMERGVVPPSENQIGEMVRTFSDMNADEGERLRAFRLLRRNRAVSDEVVSQAVNWLQSSTNSGIRRQLVQGLDGNTNALLKQPLMNLLAQETSGQVREELVDTLGSFADDPAVEKSLWELAFNDPDEDVREEAADALANRPMPPERVAEMKQRAMDPAASLDERLLALQAMRRNDVDAPEAVAAMVEMAETSTDPIERAKLFRAFDGMNDPSLMGPLVYGLQDPNPVVREEAADALRPFADDPRIKEWLNHVIQNDPDPRVKREAFSSLEQLQRRGRGDRRRD